VDVGYVVAVDSRARAEEVTRKLGSIVIAAGASAGGAEEDAVVVAVQAAFASTTAVAAKNGFTIEVWQLSSPVVVEEVTLPTTPTLVKVPFLDLRDPKPYPRPLPYPSTFNLQPSP
jgi:hypothetical protein